MTALTYFPTLVLLLLLLVTAQGADNAADDKKSCTVCTAGVISGTTDTPVLYHHVRGVGVGTFLYSLLHGAAYSALRGWVYGGPLDSQNAAGATLVSPDVIKFLFNNDGFAANHGKDPTKGLVQKVEHASDLSKVQGPPYHFGSVTFDVDDWQVYERKCPTEKFPRFRYAEQIPVLDSIFTTPFLEALRASNAPALDKVKLLFKSSTKDAPKVAIHIRRGELSLGAFKARKFTPDVYYYSTVEVIRDRYPKAEVHGFTFNTGKAGGGGGGGGGNVTAGYEGYAKRNIQIHHGMSVPEIWAHFIQADFFIMAHSSFSAVPALLNKHCVIYDNFWHGKLSRYLTLHNLKDKFDTCYKVH